MKNIILQEDIEHIYNSLDQSEKSSFDKSEILVTGCSGFLGYTIMHFYLHYADQLGITRVIGVDNFKIQKPDWLDSLKHKFPKILEIHQCNVSTDNLRQINGIEQVDFVVHMASIASPLFYRKYPLETVDANVWGLRQLLDIFSKEKLRGFLFFSSSEIYGNPNDCNIPTQEEFLGNVSCVGPRACYDEAKRFCETLCYIFSQQHEMPITIVRPFNNFGPGMNLGDARLPADLANAILNNKNITMFSDGTPTRTFCYVADAVSGYLKSLCYGKFDYFNIGMDSPEISVQKLAEIYQEKGRDLFNYPGEIIFKGHEDKAYLTHNPSRRCPDIAKARKILNFKPTIDVLHGVERYLRFLSIERNVL